MYIFCQFVNTEMLGKSCSYLIRDLRLLSFVYNMSYCDNQRLLIISFKSFCISALIMGVRASGEANVIFRMKKTRNLFLFQVCEDSHHFLAKNIGYIIILQLSTVIFVPRCERI